MCSAFCSIKYSAKISIFCIKINTHTRFIIMLNLFSFLIIKLYVLKGCFKVRCFMTFYQ